MPSALPRVFRIEPKMDERVMAFARFHDDIAAPAPIPARRSAPRHKLLPAECHTSISAATSFDANCRFINEHSTKPLHRKERKGRKGQMPFALSNTKPRFWNGA